VELPLGTHPAARFCCPLGSDFVLLASASDSKFRQWAASRDYRKCHLALGHLDLARFEVSEGTPHFQSRPLTDRRKNQSTTIMVV